MFIAQIVLSEARRRGSKYGRDDALIPRFLQALFYRAVQPIWCGSWHSVYSLR